MLIENTIFCKQYSTKRSFYRTQEKSLFFTFFYFHFFFCLSTRVVSLFSHQKNEKKIVFDFKYSFQNNCIIDWSVFALEFLSLHIENTHLRVRGKWSISMHVFGYFIDVIFMVLLELHCWFCTEKSKNGEKKKNKNVNSTWLWSLVSK